MSSFTYSSGTLGNIVGGTSGVSVAHSTNVAGLVDTTTKVQGYLSCLFTTGTSAPTVATTFNLYRIPAATAGSPNTTLSSGVTAGATSISVNSANGIAKNCLVFINQASTPSTGEIVTISAISGTTLTTNATINSYSSSDSVFLVTQNPLVSIQPGSSWAANTEYGGDIFIPGNALFAAQVKNGDATNAVTAYITADTNPTFA